MHKLICRNSLIRFSKSWFIIDVDYLFLIVSSIPYLFEVQTLDLYSTNINLNKQLRYHNLNNFKTQNTKEVKKEGYNWEEK